MPQHHSTYQVLMTITMVNVDDNVSGPLNSKIGCLSMTPTIYSSSSSINKNNVKKQNYREILLWKMKMCGLMALINYIIIYSSRNVINSLVISRMGLISKLITMVFYVQPLSLLLSFQIRKMFRKYSVGRLLNFTLIIFAIYFFIVNCLLIKFQHIAALDEFLVRDLVSDGKSSYRKYKLFCAMLSTIASWTITVQYIVIVIFEFVIQYVVIFSFFNEVFSQKSFNNFISILGICDVVGSFLSSIISAIFSRVSRHGGMMQRDVSYMVLSSVMACLCLTMLYISTRIQKAASKELFGIRNEQFKIENQNRTNDDGSPVSTDIMDQIFGNRFIVSLCFFIIFFFFTHQLLYASFENIIYQMAHNVSEHIRSSVISITNIVRGTSSCIILFCLLLPITKWLITHMWSFLVFTTPIWCGIACILMFSMDIILAGAEGLTFSFINQLMSFLNDVDLIYIRDNIDYFFLVIRLGVIIVLKIVKTISFFISKETLTMMIDRSVRPRIKSVYDGMCPLIGKSCASIIIILCSETMGTYDARVFSFVLLVMSMIGIYFWLRNTLYLCRRYNAIFMS